MKLIAALGNPGSQYALTRHNAGFLALDYLIGGNGIEAAQRKDNFNALIVKGMFKGVECMFAYPETFMNESGRAIAAIMQFYKTDINDLIVLHDEIDLPLGTIRLARNSGPAGHNGIKSIIEHLGTMDFRRIRIGIESRTVNRIPPTDVFVLQKFTDEELKKLPFEAIETMLEAEVKK
jgi:PTH1 family peptidyl-tRNA hydrolase